jgi:hypothetical protein
MKGIYSPVLSGSIIPKAYLQDLPKADSSVFMLPK